MVNHAQNEIINDHDHDDDINNNYCNINYNTSQLI